MCGSASGLGSDELGQRFAPTIRPQHAPPSLSSQSSGGVTVHRSSVNARHASTPLRPTIVMARESALLIAVLAFLIAIAWGVSDDVHPSRGERHRRQAQRIYGISTVRYETPNFSGVQNSLPLPYQPVPHSSYVTDSTGQKYSQPFYPQQQLTSIRYPESARLGLPEPIRPVQSTVATHEQPSSFLPRDSQQFYSSFSPQQQTTFQPSYQQSSFAQPRQFGNNAFQQTTFEPTFTRPALEAGISALPSQQFTINKPGQLGGIFEQNNGFRTPLGCCVNGEGSCCEQGETYTRTRFQIPLTSALNSSVFQLQNRGFTGSGAAFAGNIAESLPYEQNNGNFGYRQSSYNNYIPTSRPNFPIASNREFDRQAAFQVGVGTPAFWTEWSSWSSCIYQAQHRTRSCDYGNNALASGCLGKAAESLPCVSNGVADPRNAFGSQSQNGIADPRNVFGSQTQNGIVDPRNAFGSQTQIETNSNSFLGRRASSPVFYSQASDAALNYGQVQPTIRTYGGATAIIPIVEYRKTAKSASKL